MVTIMAVFAAQIEKKRRKSTQRSRRIEGRKGYGETNPELVRVAKRLTHGNRKQRFSLRAISGQLLEMGYSTKSGKPFSATQVKRFLEAR
jgi:hypothetical protein